MSKLSLREWLKAVAVVLVRLYELPVHQEGHPITFLYETAPPHVLQTAHSCHSPVFSE